MKSIFSTIFTVFVVFFYNKTNCQNIALTTYPVAQQQSICQGEVFKAMEIKLENLTGEDSIKIEYLLFRNSSGSITIIDSIFMYDSLNILISKTRMINGQCAASINDWIKKTKKYSVIAKTTKTGLGNSWTYLEEISFRLPNNNTGSQYINFVSFANSPYLYDCKNTIINNIELLSDGTVKNGDTVCFMQNLYFLVNSPSYSFAINKYQWIINDSLVKETKNNNYDSYLMLFPKLGINTILIKAFGNVLDTGIIKISFFVKNKPELKINILKNTICSGELLSFNIGNAKDIKVANADNGSLLFSKDSGFIRSGGLTYISVNWNTGCSTDTFLKIYEAPTPEKPEIISQGCTLLTNTIEEKYSWFVNNKYIPGSDSQLLTVQKNGMYYLEVINKYGCKNKSNLTAVYCGASSVTDVQDDVSISIYPNPVISTFKINTQKEEGFKMYNNFGVVVMTAQTDNEVDITEFPSGVYYLVTDSGYSRKITKE